MLNSVIAIKLILSKRFIFAKKKLRSINIITAVSITGIVVGVAVICVVLSVLNGFRHVVSSLFLTIDSNVQLVATHGQSIKVTDSLLFSLKELDEVETAERFIEGKVIIAAKEKSSVVILKAIESGAIKRLTGYMDIRRGFGSNDLAIGGGVANRLGVMYQNEVIIIGSKAIDEGLEAIKNPLASTPPKLPVMTIENFFRTHRVFDDIYILSSFEAGQRVFEYKGDESTGIDIRPSKDIFGKPIPDSDLKSAVSSWILRNNLSEQLQTSTLEDKFSDLFQVMKMEKWGSFLALMLIIVVASLSLIGSLTMTAIDKRHDLYFLRCIGLRTKDIQHIFLIEGALIGAIGVSLGIAIGYTMSYLQQLYGFFKLPYGNAFIVKSYPIFIEPWDFIWIALFAFTITILASMYPAHRAAKLSENLSAHRL